MKTEILNKSFIGSGFLKKKNINLTVDEMLDCRKRVEHLRETKSYPDEWYQQEIDAIDEIIRIISH